METLTTYTYRCCVCCCYPCCCCPVRCTTVVCTTPYNPCTRCRCLGLSKCYCRPTTRYCPTYCCVCCCSPCCCCVVTKCCCCCCYPCVCPLRCGCPDHTHPLSKNLDKSTGLEESKLEHSEQKPLDQSNEVPLVTPEEKVQKEEIKEEEEIKQEINEDEIRTDKKE